MDKDIERLGKERLLRQKIRKNWGRVLIALAVLVLGITVYQLIQPASAEDKDKAEFTVDNEKDTYTNLVKLSNIPQAKLDGNSAGAWNGESFDISVALDFMITKEEANNAGNNYYYVFSEGVYISDKLCSKWYDHQDTKGRDAFSYHFLKTDDGRYAVVIKFVEGYIDSDITAGIKFSCSAKGTVDHDGDVEIDLGGDVIIEVDSTDVKWEQNTSVNYDIYVEKSTNTNNQVVTDNNGKQYVDYVLKISSTKGTPDEITITDVLKGNGIKVDTNNANITITKNGGSNVSNANAKVTDKGNGEYQLDATLPKLKKGEYYTVTYRYYLDTSSIKNGNGSTMNNRVTVSSEDKNSHEKVVDTSSCQVSYSKSTVSKSGRYENGVIYWTINVNTGNENIAGKKITDTMFGQAENFKITSNEDPNGRGYRINKNGNFVQSVDFVALSNNSNTSSYTITYTTKASQGFSNNVVKNTVDFDGDGTTAEVTVPGAGVVKKTLEKETDDNVNKRYSFEWKSVITVPDEGLIAGTEIRDELRTTIGTDDHYMDFYQVGAAFNAASAAFGYGSIDNFQVKVGNDWINWSTVANNPGAYAKYTGFKFKLNKTISKWEKQTVEFKYNSTGSYASGVDTNYVNTIWVGSVESTAEFRREAKVIKTDDNGRQGTTQRDGTEDGLVTWRVMAKLYNDTDKYVITDTLPKGISIKSVSVECGWNNGNRYELPSLDGTTYTVDDYGKYWATAGISVAANVTSNGEASVVTTTVNRTGQCNTWYDGMALYVTYVCHIDGYEEAEQGKVYNLRNSVKVSTNKVQDFGDSWQTQIITKPSSSESGDEETETGEDILTKSYVWRNTDKILNYTVTINPEGKDLVEGVDKLQLKDVVEYNNRTYTTGTEDWEVHLIPTTVALYKGIMQDGKLKAGELVTDWKWQYSEERGQYEWQQSYCTITATVPDGCPLILKYSYSVNATHIDVQYGDGKAKLSIKNTATLEGQWKDDVSTDNKDLYYDEGTSAYIYKSNSYTFYKVAKDSYGELLPDAEFTVYKYNQSKGKYESIRTYKTNEKGEFTVEFNLKDYEYNQQYYIVETKAPKGYLLPDNPQKYYFFCGVDDTTKYPIKAPNSQLEGKDLSNDGRYIEFVEDEKAPTTSIAVYKYWTDSDNNRITRNEGSIFLQVYQINENGQSNTYGNLIEVKPDNDGYWFYSIKNLPKTCVDENGRLTSYNYKYFVEEVGIDEKYKVSGYSASYVYLDQDGNGFIVTDGKNTTQGIEGGTVEITNKSTAYELPATGGSGKRWLYMLSGLVLALFAAISLIYKINKSKIIN